MNLFQIVKKLKKSRLEMRVFFNLLAVLALASVISAQIHRATSKQDYQMKYSSNYTTNYLLKQLNLENNSKLEAGHTILARLFGLKEDKLYVWVSTVLGTFFVGVCGIVPVLILPQLADDHTKLGIFRISATFKLV